MDLGAHNEAFWIEGVKHVADHAVLGCRGQWIRQSIPAKSLTLTGTAGSSAVLRWPRSPRGVVLIGGLIQRNVG